MQEEDTQFNPIFNPNVKLSQADCFNCLFAYYEDGDPMNVSCVVYDDKPNDVQFGRARCNDATWELSTADTELLQYIVAYHDHATRYFIGYDDQIHIDQVKSELAKRRG